MSRSLAPLLVCLMVLGGCQRMHTKENSTYVFVTAEQGFLRDRVAAVSNRVAGVSNGEKLQVLDHARHFLKVQTAKGQIGWIEERLVATPETVDAFYKMRDSHKDDPEIAGGVTHDKVYMHIQPGRDSDRFYLLQENTKIKLLRRAVIAKPGGVAAAVQAQKAIPEAAGTHAVKKGSGETADAVAVAPVVAPAMEDWWLVRDAQGHTGWLFGRMVDVDAPDTLLRYAEGQKFVGAYVLTTVHDEGAPTDLKDIPVYVVAMNSYKSGLPYDFDQVRVYTWSMQHHRYETGFRDKNIEGYLPLTVTKMKDPYGKSSVAGFELPAFSYKLLTADAPAVVPNPKTGEIRPTKTVTKTYRLEGNLVRSVAPVGALPPWVAHPEEEKKQEKKKR